MGEDVEAIPYITDEIIRRINNAINKQKGEIAIVELGGTAGEYQNIFYYEASRILTLKNPGDVVHIHVSYLPTPAHLGEPKTKPAQLSVRTLNTMGIQPDFLIARSDKPLDKRRRERFSLFCNMRSHDIISNPDVDNVYEVPLQFEQKNLTRLILEKLNLPLKKPNLSRWRRFIEKIKKLNKATIKIAIVGKYFATGNYQLRDSYAALIDAINHSAWAFDVNPQVIWVDAEKVEKEGIEKFTRGINGLIVPIGWGERGAEGMITAAGYARQNLIPYLGLCYGMQLAVVSFARDVLGWQDANTTENDKNTTHPIIHLIPQQKEILKRRAYGGTMRLGTWKAVINKKSYTWEIYKKYNGFTDESRNIISERHRHRFEFNDKYVEAFEKHGLVIAARSKIENLVEIIELPRHTHPFYIGVQGHPEYKSRPFSPHPLFLEFVSACLQKKRMVK